MIFLFLAFITSKKILGIDFGSQTIKFGYANLDTKETHLGDYPRDRGIPAAIAIKTKKNSNERLTNETLDGISLKFGQKAIPYLRKHPQHGSHSLLNSIIRDLPEYNTFTLTNKQTLLSLYFVQFLAALRDQPDYLSITFPAFFTPAMRQLVANSLSFFRVPLKHVSDDIQAISALYSDTYLNRFEKSSRQVLFVDVGYSYAKVYVINFTFQTNHSLAETIAYDWSEKCSAHGFAQALSRSARLPIHTAEKMLKDVTDDVEFAKDEIAELKRLINQTVHIAGLVDEAQIIGGASQYPFVYEAVSEAAKYVFKPTPKPKPVAANTTTPENRTETTTEEQPGNTDQTATEKVGDEKAEMASTEFTSPQTNSTVENATSQEPAHVVLREFDPINCIAEGMLHLALMVENSSMFNPTYMRKRPSSNYYVKCGNRVDIFCQKNTICKEPFVPKMNGCPDNMLQILVDKRQTPAGSPEVIGRYFMTNISNIEFNNGTEYSRGYIRTRNPDPTVESVFWCNQSDICYNIDIQDVTIPNFYESADFELFKAITARFGIDPLTQDYLNQVKELLKKIKKAIKPSETETAVKIDSASREKFNTIKSQFKSGELAQSGKEKVMEARDELKSIGLALGLKFN